MSRTQIRRFMRLPFGAVACLACIAVSGCAHPQAKNAVPPPPALEVPVPPLHIVEATDGEIPQPVGLISEPARSQPPRLRPAPAPPPPRPEASKVELPKVEPPPVDAAKPAEEQPRPQPPVALQTTPSQRDAEVEGRIRALIARANADLGRIDYRTLGIGPRTQYDAARSFIRQADEALRDKKLEFAASLADKAAVLATQLAGR